MTSALFITGSSGFIGSKLLRKVDQLDYDRVYCLIREKNSPICSDVNDERIEFIVGTLHDQEVYAPYLEKSDTAVNLAAVTGKADREQYFQVNAHGAELFTQQCERSGVKELLHVSTIAVKYPDKSNYPYAESKALGEEVVRQGGLNYTIVRPTIVIGRDSAIWKNLSMMATAPIIPLIGNGKTKIQPIYIEDLVDCLITILKQRRFSNETLELGGPEVVSFESFLRAIHQTRFHRTARVFHVPAKQLMAVLNGLERVLPLPLPVTAGQLSAFCNNGTIEGNWVFNDHRTSMRNVCQMIEIVARKQESTKLATGAARECQVFAQYLVGEPANEYVLDKYREAHLMSGAFANQDNQPFDRLLVVLATRHPILTRLVDTYTAIFARGSLFRKKMILLMAIMESCAPTYVHFDAGTRSSKGGLIMRMIAKGIAFGLVLAISVVLFSPVHIALLAVQKLSRRGGQS